MPFHVAHYTHAKRGRRLTTPATALLLTPTNCDAHDIYGIMQSKGKEAKAPMHASLSCGASGRAVRNRVTAGNAASNVGSLLGTGSRVAVGEEGSHVMAINMLAKNIVRLALAHECSEAGANREGLGEVASRPCAQHVDEITICGLRGLCGKHLRRRAEDLGKLMQA
jgi:hypothetical protein